MSAKRILAVDQSTSGSKALLVNERGQIFASDSLEHAQLYPQPGWVEHDPEEILSNVNELIARLPAQTGLSLADVDVLALTNQRETVVVWNRHTGKPIHHAIVWQDRRTADMCKQWKAEGLEDRVNAKTGLTLDPYFSATKVSWLLDHVAGAREQAENGDLLLGTIDSWLIWHWTGGQVHATDYTNASRTLLFNIHTLTWDDELLQVFRIPRAMLPEVRDSDASFGDAHLAGHSLAICGVIGDSQGALFGQKCWQPGMIKATYGTGTSLLMNTGETARAADDSGLVTAIAWGARGKVDYALEGIIHSSGDTVRWVKDQLHAFDDFAQAEAMVQSLTDNTGVYLVPAFVGLGAPYWDPYAKAAIVGMSRDTGLAHIVRAAMESMTYQVTDVVNLMTAHADVDQIVLRADGGATGNQFLMQFQAEMLRADVICSNTAELSAMGAVYMAGLGTGIWPSLEAIAKLETKTTVYTPKLPDEQVIDWYAGWKKAVERVILS